MKLLFFRVGLGTIVYLIILKKVSDFFFGIFLTIGAVNGILLNARSPL